MNKKVKFCGYWRYPWDVKIIKDLGALCSFCGADDKLCIRAVDGIFIAELKRKECIYPQFKLVCKSCAGKKGKAGSKFRERNRQIVAMYAVYRIKEIAVRMKISHQRVAQILIRAEKAGEIDRRGLILQRKREAMVLADSFNKYSEKYRPHIQY